jgi:hypothetical protein
MSSAVLSYKFPAYNPYSTGANESWQAVQPTNGNVFRTDQGASIIIPIANNQHFLKSNQSYLSFVVTPRDAAGNAVALGTTRNSYQGCSRLFNRVIVRIGSQIIEDLSYDDLCALYYATNTTGKKSVLSKTEGFSNTQLYTAGARAHVMALITSMMVTPQAIPLPLLFQNAAFSLELFLAPTSNYLTVSTGISYLELSQVSFKYQAVTPPIEYTASLVAGVRGGRSAYIPVQVVRRFESAGTGSTKLSIVLPVGGVSSVVSADVCFFDQATYGTQSSDKYLRFNSANLIDYKIEGGGVTLPQTSTFSGVAGSAETLLFSLLSAGGNGYSVGDQFTFDANYDTASYRLHYSWQADSETFGSGLNTIGAASPNIIINTTHSQVVPTSTTVVTFVTMDALVIIEGSQVTLAYTW